MDATSSAIWTIQPNAAGAWLNNIYFSANAGTWQITCYADGLVSYATLTVNHGTALSITVSPSTATLTAGWPQAFIAKAYDSNGNSWDVSNTTSWRIDSGAGGSWIGSTYYSNAAGNWTVTGNYSGSTSTASITVNHALATNITVGISSNSITGWLLRNFYIDCLRPLWQFVGCSHHQPFGQLILALAAAYR